MDRTMSGSRLDMRRRRRRELWCSVPGSVSVKFMTPSKKGLLNQARMRASKMGKGYWYLFHALGKKFSEAEGWCPPAG